MKLKDLKIGTQLRLGMGAVLVLVVFLGALAWIQTDRSFAQTQEIYDHPLMVRRAVGEIKADVLAMSGEMRGLLLAENDQARQATLQKIDGYEADAEQEFQIVYDRFLGPRTDIDEAFQSFVQWKAVRAETVRLVQAGKTAEALARVRPAGVDAAQAEKALAGVQKLATFAEGRADQFFADASTLDIAINWQIAIVVCIALLASAGIAWFLLRQIRDPLKELTAVTGRYRQGDTRARSRYSSANEFGSLATAFNEMAETVEDRMRLQEDAARLAGVMLMQGDKDGEVRSFSRALLQALLELTGSQVGAVYVLNSRAGAFEHCESIGLGAGRRGSFSATACEGEFGAALATKHIQRVTDIPEDSRFSFTTVSGDFNPREIVTIPVLADGAVVAVVSLASVRNYSEQSVELVHEIWNMLTARLNGVLAFRSLRESSETLEHQNRELEAQKRELSAQAGELTAQNRELEVQKRQLDEASRLKSTFLSNMSHELRTPLSSVIALSGVLHRRLANAIPEEEFSYLEVIERNGKQLLALINDILQLSRVESGHEKLHVTRFPVSSLVGEIVDTLALQAREKNIALLNEVNDDLPRVSSDLDKCRHVLQNLVGNAVKFTESGTVRISAREVDHSLQVTVSDTGIGITADQLPHIFDEFRQGDERASRKYGGTGLGLAIARRYASLLHGRVTVESTPGAGSAFTFELPLRIAASDGGAAVDEPREHSGRSADASPSPSVTGHGKSILLVDDTEPIVIQMTDILAGEGYDVRVARNGKEALEQIEAALPDAVILDLMMPEVDGFQVLRAIRDSERTAQLPVLILTAKYVTREELSFLTGNNVHQLIQKGDIGRAELLSEVASMVATRQPDPAPPPAPSFRRTARKPPAGKPVVLVVEDNRDNLRTMQALLEDAYTRIEAADGRSGVEQAKRHVPDLILMDLALPVMDGYAALSAIREEETLRHIPVVAVTASAMEGDREQILARGFDGYISKPIDVEALGKTLREVLFGG